MRLTAALLTFSAAASRSAPVFCFGAGAPPGVGYFEFVLRLKRAMGSIRGNLIASESSNKAQLSSPSHRTRAERTTRQARRTQVAGPMGHVSRAKPDLDGATLMLAFLTLKIEGSCEMLVARVPQGSEPRWAEVIR
jgi:hypothetical protein